MTPAGHTSPAEVRAKAPARLVLRQVIPIVPGEQRRRVVEDGRGVPYGIDMQTGQMVRLQGRSSREQRRRAQLAEAGPKPTRRDLKRQRRAAAAKAGGGTV